MDGTLLDTQKIFIPAWEYAGRLQNVTDMGNCIQYVCGMNDRGWTKYISDNYATINIDRFKADVNHYISENLVVKYKKGALELLNFLKESNIKIGLASGSSMAVIENNFSFLGGTKQFDAIVSGLEVKNCKPAPDIFLETAKRMNVKPENCYVFEDSGNGILSGNSAGMKCIGIADVAPFDGKIKQILYKELNSLDEAIEILKKQL